MAEDKEGKPVQSQYKPVQTSTKLQIPAIVLIWTGTSVHNMRQLLIFLAWSVHNVIVHPLCELLFLVSMLSHPFEWLGDLGRWLHENSTPAPERRRR